MTQIIRLIKNAFSEVLAHAGYSLVPTWRLANRPMARHLGRLFAQYDVDCVIDVGANEGGYAKFLRQEVGYRGLIHSFEPISRLAENCRKLAQGDPMWRIHQYALGEIPGNANINVMKSSEFSSFLEPMTEFTSVFQNVNTVDHTECVSVQTLESVMPVLQNDSLVRHPYLKIDTQGFDMAVIRGAGKTLDSLIAVQTELSFRPLYRNMAGWQDVIDLLQKRGFDVSNMFAVSIDTDLRALEFDCILLNSRFAQPAL